jgi:4,5-dihydroxyphthalate decarboxylase
VAELPLVLACWDYDRTRALQDGRVRPEGIELTYLPLGMPESFFRMLHHGEFDVSEMSFSWFTRTLSFDEPPLVAIPVFPSRMFRHSAIYVHAGSGIDRPADLIGKHVGVPEYQMTAAVWIKGILAEHYYVPVASVTYHTGGLRDPGRTELPMNLPPEIVVTPIGEGETLSELIESGGIDALYTAEAPETFRRGSPNVRRLFTDHAAAEREYFAKTGIFPIMHTIVIRRDVYEKSPWVAQSLVKAFEAAKEITYEDLEEVTALKVTLPWLTAEVERTKAAMGTDDFWPYGLDANRETIATFLGYSHDQGLLPRRFEPEELFAPETVRTVRV